MLREVPGTKQRLLIGKLRGRARAKAAPARPFLGALILPAQHTGNPWAWWVPRKPSRHNLPLHLLGTHWPSQQALLAKAAAHPPRLPMPPASAGSGGTEQEELLLDPTLTENNGGGAWPNCGNASAPPACILPAPCRWQDASPRWCRTGCSWLWEAAVPPWRQERPHPAHNQGTGRELAKPGHCILAFRLSPGTLRPGEHAAARLPAMGQSWSPARAGSTDILILTTAAGPSPRRSFSHGHVLAGKLRFPTGGCQGGFINCRPLLWLQPSPWGGQKPGDPPRTLWLSTGARQ